MAPTDGYIQIKNFTGVYKYGTVAKFLCNQGYQLIGDKSRYFNLYKSNSYLIFWSICIGNWTGQPPSCSPISCGYPPKLENGELELLNSSTTLFSLAAYHCKGSFRFNTSSDKGFQNNQAIKALLNFYNQICFRFDIYFTMSWRWQMELTRHQLHVWSIISGILRLAGNHYQYSLCCYHHPCNCDLLEKRLHKMSTKQQAQFHQQRSKCQDSNSKHDWHWLGELGNKLQQI